jgi:hypothetical protein
VPESIVNERLATDPSAHQHDPRIVASPTCVAIAVHPAGAVYVRAPPNPNWQIRMSVDAKPVGLVIDAVPVAMRSALDFWRNAMAI